jgi:hypothetical protein
LEKRRDIIPRGRSFLPRVLGLFHSIFIDQGLKGTFPFPFASGTNHGVVKEDELELESSRFLNFRGLGDDLHSIPGWGEAGELEFFFPFLLNHTEPAGTKRDEPSVMAEGGNRNPSGLGCIEDHLPLLNFNLDAINL